MNVQALYLEVRKRYPEVSASADRVHLATWGEPDDGMSYVWFGSLATALNRQMNRAVDVHVHQSLFDFLAQAAAGATPEVLNCIDVSFVENLFWQVPSHKAMPYWRDLPEALKALYLGFHGRAP